MTRLLDWLLRRTLPPGAVGDSIRGDLLEELHAGRHGATARLRYAARATALAVRFAFRRRLVPDPQTASRRRPHMDSIRHDLKFAARTLVHQPAFSVLVVATLALGIGAATAIFSIVDGILLRPLPFAEPQRLVAFNETTPGGRMNLAWPNFLDFKEHSRSFSAVATVQSAGFTTLGDRPQRIPGRYVTSSFLDVLGVQPLLGRTFRPEDDMPGAPPVALISHPYWQESLAGDANVLGRTLRTTEYAFTIVGVLPPQFRFGTTVEIYAPIGLTTGPNAGLLDRGNHFGLLGVARLAPGVTREQAQAELERIAAALGREYPKTNTGAGAEVQMLRDRFVERVAPTLVALMGSVGFLLLLACANVANLLLARGAARQHELAIRTALGSSPWRLVRQLLVESTLLSTAGGACGIAVAAALVKTLVAFAPADIPRLDQVGIHTTSLMFALAASVLSGLVFGVFPALQTAGSRGEHLLARASRTGGAVAPRRTRRVLMAVEVALAAVLLAGCGLMLRTMAQLAAVDPGFRTDHLLTARVSLSGDHWNAPERRVAFYDRALETVKQLPGVTNAALTLSLPIDGSNWGSIFIVGDKPVPPHGSLPAAAFVPVSADYFETVEMAVRGGRAFDARDRADSQPVAIVNDTAARRLWPGESALGKRIKQGWPEEPGTWCEVVGVVSDVKLEGVDQDTPLQIFLPLPQLPGRNVAFVVRTSTAPEGLAAALEAAVQRVQPDLPVTRILAMTQLMTRAVAGRRLSTMIFAVFAAVAMLIAAVGLYGVVSQSVTERTREIGLRMALGAERRRVLGMFVRQGLLTAIVGIGAGTAGAVMLSKWIEQLVFNVAPRDPATLGAVACLLLGVAALACYAPARRATRVDPLMALKAD
jgi:putative ABC transport system permease protein